MFTEKTSSTRRATRRAPDAQQNVSRIHDSRRRPTIWFGVFLFFELSPYPYVPPERLAARERCFYATDNPRDIVGPGRPATLRSRTGLVIKIIWWNQFSLLFPLIKYTSSLFRVSVESRVRYRDTAIARNSLSSIHLQWGRRSSRNAFSIGRKCTSSRLRTSPTRYTAVRDMSNETYVIAICDK